MAICVKSDMTITIIQHDPIKGYMTLLTFLYRWGARDLENNSKFSGYITGTSSSLSVPKTQSCHIPFNFTV